MNAPDADTYIEFELSRSTEQIRTNRINNVFNLTQQFNIERQASLRFCLFGLVESNFTDTNDVIIDIKESGALNMSLPKISSDCISEKTFSIKTYGLTPGTGMSRNLYGKMKSVYSFMFEIDKNELTTSDNLIKATGGTPSNRYITLTIIDNEKNIYNIQQVPYLFYDTNGNVVNFGTQDTDIDAEGNTIVINNDFPFFYDRHWIKTYFNLSAPSFVLFPQTNINITAGTLSSLSQFQIAIDQPSPFGFEKTTVYLDMESSILNPVTEFNFIPQTIHWNIGEQYKNVNVDLVGTLLVQPSELLVFKTSGYTMCLPINDTGITLNANIIDINTPSKISFTQTSLSVKNNISTINVSYVFDKPIDIPGQNITLYYTSASTAVLDSDWYFSTSSNTTHIRPGDKSIVLNFNVGDISGSTTINIISKPGYQTDKTLEFAFENPTQNIIINSIRTIAKFDKTGADMICQITITDSVIKQFNTFVIPYIPDKNIGIVRSYNIPDMSGNYSWNNDTINGFTKVSSFNVDIINNGDQIVYNDILYTNGSHLPMIIINHNTISGDTSIILPSNSDFDFINDTYNKTKYKFSFTTPDTFAALESFTTLPYPFNPVEVLVDNIAGNSGRTPWYLTTELDNFYTNFNSVNNSCSVSVSLAQKSLTNCLVFMGYNPFNLSSSITSSSIKNTFENSKVSVQCSQFLSVGNGLLPNAPYNFTYLNLNLRNLYLQTGVTTFDNSLYKGFDKWENSNLQNTKHALIVGIKNNGDIPVVISGQTINYKDEFLIMGANQDLNNLSITLPANEKYNGQDFTVADYIVSIKNISYYLPNGQLDGTPRSFNFITTNQLETGKIQSAAPKYYCISEYVNILVPHKIGLGGIDCSGNITSINKESDIAIRGLLLINSGSGFKSGQFVSLINDLDLTCLTAPIPFKFIS
jgi:hypothetical protein